MTLSKRLAKIMNSCSNPSCSGKSSHLKSTSDSQTLEKCQQASNTESLASQKSTGLASSVSQRTRSKRRNSKVVVEEYQRSTMKSPGVLIKFIPSASTISESIQTLSPRSYRPDAIGKSEKADFNRGSSSREIISHEHHSNWTLETPNPPKCSFFCGDNLPNLSPEPSLKSFSKYLRCDHSAVRLESDEAKNEEILQKDSQKVLTPLSEAFKTYLATQSSNEHQELELTNENDRLSTLKYHQLHRSKTFIVGLIDRALTRELGIDGKTGKNKDPHDSIEKGRGDAPKYLPHLTSTSVTTMGTITATTSAATTPTIDRVEAVKTTENIEVVKVLVNFFNNKLIEDYSKGKSYLEMLQKIKKKQTRRIERGVRKLKEIDNLIQLLLEETQEKNSESVANDER